MPSLAELLGYLVQPLGGPMIPALAKSQSNATAGSIPGVAPPKGQPLSSPAEMMAALTAIGNSQYENKLRQAQAQELERLGTFRDKLSGSFEDVMKLMGGGGAAPAAAPAAAPFSLGGPAVGETAPGPTSFSPVPDKSNFASGLRKLTELGVNPEVAAGAVTYMDRNENGFNPLAVNPDSGAFGRGQWLGPRKKNLISQYGNRPTDDQQAEFMGDELTGKFPDAQGVLNRLLAAKTSKEGYDIWGTHYERPGAAALAKAGVGGALRGPGPSYASVGSQQTPQERELWIRGRADAATAELANASQHAPVNTITPLASGQGAPMSMAPGMPAAGAMSPMQQAIVRLGVMSRMAKMGDVADPLEKMFYNSPQQKGEVANAEEFAKLRAQLGFAGPLAGAKTQAERTVTEPSDIRIATEKSALEAQLKRMEQERAASLRPTTIRIGDQEIPVTEQQYADIVSGRGGAPGSAGPQPGGALPFGRNIPAEELRKGQTTARIAVDTKAAEDVGAQATLARRLMPLIDEVVRHADTTPEGFAGPWAATAARTLSGFGINVAPGLTNAELLESVSRQLIPLVREPGATSERELDNYLKAVPGLKQSAEGRKKIAGMMKEVMQGSIDIADIYRDNVGSPDLKEKLAKFSDERRAKLDRAVLGGGNFKEGDVASSPGKPDLILRDGKWVPMQ